MSDLNKCILLVMKWLDDPESVSKDELAENRKAANAADAYAADAAASSAATASSAEKWVNKYFERTGENKQDYIDAIEASKKSQEPESKEWDGEGLPPIGCECEVSFFNQAFESGVILFMGSEMAIINLNSTGYSEQHCHLNSTHFRPLKTQEQKDREAFIDAGIISYDNCEAKLFVDYVKLLLGKMFDDGFKAPEGE